MEKGRKKGLLSGLLLRLGDAIRFAPKTEYLSAELESEPKKKRRFEVPFFDTAHRLKLKTVLARAYEQSFLLGAVRRLCVTVLSTRMRSWAILLLFSGLMSVFSYFARNAFWFLEGSPQHLILGITQIVLALWVAFDRLTLSQALKKSLLFRAALRPLFGVEEWEIPDENVRDHPFWMVLLGLAAGALQAFFTPAKVFFWVLCAVCLLLIFYKPEAGLFLYALTIFASRSWQADALLTATWLSFFCKAAVGKRSLHFGKTDLLAIPAVIWILVSGGTRSEKLSLILLVSLYALCCNLIRTLENVRRLTRALSVSLASGAFLSLLRGVLLRFLSEQQFSRLALPDLAPAGTMLVIAALCPILLGYMRSAGKFSRFLGILTLAAVLTAFWFLQNPFLWVALLAGIWLFWLFSRRSALLTSVIVFLTGAAVLPLLPQKILAYLAGLFGFTEATLEGLRQMILTSAGTFSSALPGGIGLDGAAPPAGLYFEIGIRFGIPGMALFYLLLFSFFFSAIRFARTTTRREIHPLVLGALCAVLTVLVGGFFQPISSVSLAALLLIAASFPKAATLACRREEVRLPY